jgi:Late embryogenesis abundant protein
VIGLPGLLLASVLASSPVAIRVDPKPGGSFEVSLAGPSEAGSGEFRGRVSLSGSPAELPLSGRAEASGGRLLVTATARYADVPSDWLARFRPDSFEYAIRGEVSGGGAVSWSGTMRWSEVGVVGHSLISRFLKLASFELTGLSEKRTEGRAVLAVTNPFSFPLTVAAANYKVRVSGQEIGGGTARGKTARSRKTSALELPFAAEEKKFLAAAGDRWAVGAPVPAELTGLLTLRLPSGDGPVPLVFSEPMGTDGARSGVFAYPEGGTSLSPH